jgi:hypothetical protein
LVSAIPINLRRSPEHFSKSAIPQICAPSRAFSSPELRHSQTADDPKVSIEGVMPANPDG